jgi:hypothetical protein
MIGFAADNEAQEQPQRSRTGIGNVPGDVLQKHLGQYLGPDDRRSLRSAGHAGRMSAPPPQTSTTFSTSCPSWNELEGSFLAYNTSHPDWQFSQDHAVIDISGKTWHLSFSERHQKVEGWHPGLSKSSINLVAESRRFRNFAPGHIRCLYYGTVPLMNQDSFWAITIRREIPASVQELAGCKSRAGLQKGVLVHDEHGTTTGVDFEPTSPQQGDTKFQMVCPVITAQPPAQPDQQPHG